MTARVVLKSASRRVWLRHRREGLGGTDVAAVLGVNPWRTPLDVWLEKTDRDTDLEFPPGYAMRRGTYLERFMIAEYQRTYPEAILERPPALLAHPDLPWLRASLDHLAHHRDETRIVEVKTAGWRQRDAWWDDQQLIPDMYAVQVLAYLAVTGLDVCDVIADIAGDWTSLQILRDPQWEASQLPYLDDWWQRYVVKDTPPPIDVDRDGMAALNRTWVTDPGEALWVPAGDELLDTIRRAQDHRRIAKTNTTAYDKERRTIRASMRTAQRITTDPDLRVAAWIDARGVLQIPDRKDTPT